MSIMRIAVAGTGGLALQIARCIEEETSHQVMLVSRSYSYESDVFEAKLCCWRTTQQKHRSKAKGSMSLLTVDYNDEASLTYALRGIDTIISTVTGSNQVRLIKAAVAARVRRFAPAEFEGSPQARPSNPQDVLDRGRSAARQWLVHYSSHIETTTLVCGIFYERFKRGGLAQARIGLGTGWSGAGDYILDCTNMSAQVPAFGVNGQADVTICLTSLHDVALFVTKAIDLPTWPAELRMRGERVNVQLLMQLVQRLMGREFNPLTTHSINTLRDELAVAAAQGDWARGMRVHTLIATAEGRYDFGAPNLNEAFPNVQPERFATWFRREWGLEEQ